MTPLRQFINDTLLAVSGTFSARSVLNAGARIGETDRAGRLYRDYFPVAKYTTLDKRPGADIRGDLSAGEIASHRHIADLVLCVSVLEHVERPSVAARNLRHFLAPGGHLFVAVPFLYPYHPGRDFGDYWRFTADGLRLLFPGMTEVFIRAAPADAGFCALFKEARQ